VILVANDVITPKIWPGGKGFFCAEATWGGGSVKLQVKMPNGTYADVASSTLSANGGLMVELPAGDVKAVVATATAVYARLENIP
jgi:hypothetical protein